MTDKHTRRLRDILDAIDRIRTYAPATREELEHNHVAQDAIAHRFMIIGEAVYHLPPDLLADHPEIPWADIAGMRHVIVHDYDRVNMRIVWEAIHNDLAALERTVREMLNKHDGPT